MAQEKKPDLGKVMVIGGCGFLGHHVVRLLLRDYTCSVSVIDLRCTRNRRPDSDGVAYFEADITDAPKVEAIFEKVRPDVVIHTASPPAQGNDIVSHALFKKVNVDGTTVIVKACQKTGVKALVYTSSASVVSDNQNDLINADERWPVMRGKDQSEYYSETKAAAEQIVLAANRAAEAPKLLTCSIRPSGIMGEGDMMTLYHMINIYRQGRTNVQIGNNDNLFDFTYVENVAHGHLLAARALLATAASNIIPLDHERVDGEVFFITNDSPVYFWDFCRAVWAAAGSPHGTEHVKVLPKSVGLVLGYLSEWFFWLIGKPPTFNRQRIIFSCMTRYYDITKAKRRLGYKPLVPLDEAVRRSVKWTLEQEQKQQQEKN
ncbi:C-3 sterol dehydrogenase/C-4-like protein [Thermochaetoides thermophila DSM 1495]|uniref:Sterol-4-alpha-carboxylate 3-dehydrogenase ERG26, decarboxylating n=1 Tax=Chaetomium thermophilum (strain DSM 1495 / CBS 144.50 / IMI 039719) TaxID=759272 RepID=G0S0C5_CHATD|nr:C-3 sterol dehydrogenase/C-4-like protein [Thermochaetoides thermophila DSM 1495]EGS23286.1 C-3 sterol dehydrogenase/C-4-like protein [Thermochaetoides thermophila DSM 1495]